MRQLYKLLSYQHVSMFKAYKPAKNNFYFSNRIPVQNMTSTSVEEQFTAVFVTTPDIAAAKKIAYGLIEQKIAACVNIIPQITSIYSWEGKVNEDAEVLLMIKTRKSRVDDLTKFVNVTHPYSTPEVISLPIENGSSTYLDWISKTVPKFSVS